MAVFYYFLSLLLMSLPLCAGYPEPLMAQLKEGTHVVVAPGKPGDLQAIIDLAVLEEVHDYQPMQLKTDERLKRLQPFLKPAILEQMAKEIITDNSAPQFRRTLAGMDPSMRIIVVRNAQTNQVLGYLDIEFSTVLHPIALYRWLRVHPQLRNKGIASLLIEYGETVFPKAESVSLKTHAEFTTAIEFYQKRGFEQIDFDDGMVQLNKIVGAKKTAKQLIEEAATLLAAMPAQQSANTSSELAPKEVTLKNGRQIIVRQGIESDYKDIIDLAAIEFRQDYFPVYLALSPEIKATWHRRDQAYQEGLISSEIERSLESQREYLLEALTERDCLNRVIVARDEETNAFLGYLDMRFIGDDGEPRVYYNFLRIDPDFRKQGIGSALLDYGETFFPQARSIVLKNYPALGSAHFYQKRGFEKTPLPCWEGNGHWRENAYRHMVQLRKILPK